MIAPTAPIVVRARAVKVPARITSGISPTVILLSVWLLFEFGRPQNAFKIPMMIGIVSFITWVVRRNKQWTPQSWCFLGLIGVMWVGVPFAANNFKAFWTSWDMMVFFLTIVLPLQSVLTSVVRLRIWIYTFLAISLYVAAWAFTHQGYGPSGADGAQDENYVAALVGMAIPFAYFALFADKRVWVKILLAGTIVIFCGAMVVQQNPSRGGFLGLVAVVLYCLWRSPRKLLGLGIISAGVVTVVLLAGPAYWAEIATSTDYQSGTGSMRIEVWKMAVRMWQAHPLIGVGARNLAWVLNDYQTPEQVAKLGRFLGGSIIAHSLHVELMAELGSAGIIMVAVLVGGTWRDLGRVQRKVLMPTGTQSESRELVELRCYADATRASILAILVNGIFLSLLYYTHLWLLIGVGCAIPHVYRAMAPAAEPLARAPVAVGRRSGVALRRAG